ncbi:MAG: hypothetical protein FWG10_14405 [Eubacteriaceae bacterium]|nr:hypothetical protein [Eubacteriaceae bacterium]
MYVSYMEMSRREPRGVPVLVNPGNPVLFDTVLESVGTTIEYDLSTGIFTFLEEGFFYFDWYVAPQHGITTDGSNWAIQTTLSQSRFIGSSHSHIAATLGFAIVRAVNGEKASLINVSDGPIYLSQAALSKAGLIVLSIAGVSDELEFAP